MGKQELHCYTRVSTTEQKKSGSSLKSQKEIGQRISKKLNLKFIHRDEGVHSSTVKNKGPKDNKFHYREELEDLKDDIQSGKVKHIWCQDRSRMFRDMMDTIMFRREYLMKYKVRVYEGEHGKEIDFEDEDTSVMYDIIGRLEEHENRKRTLKSERGKLKKLERLSGEKSVFMGGRSLFGYVNIHKEWKIEKDESVEVKKIFDKYESGVRLKEIMNFLNSSGVLTRGGGLWTIGTIHNMLHNKTYTGLHTIHLKRFDKTFSYKVPRIITVSQFNRVQKILFKNQKNKDNNSKEQSLLNGLMVCECGTSIGSLIRDNKRNGEVVSTTKKYYCLNKGYKWKGKVIDCSNSKSLDMDRMNETVLRLVKETVKNSNVLKEKFKNDVMKQKSKSDKELNENKKVIEDIIQRIQVQIDNIETQMVNLEVDLTLGKKEESMVRKLTSRYQEELDKLHERNQSMEDELEQLDKDTVWLDWITRFGKELNTNVKSNEKQREFLEGVVSKIIVHSSTDRVRDKDVQFGHSLEIQYKMKIVGDKLRYKDNNKKSKGYDVKEGRFNLETETIGEITLQRGRSWVKKN